MDILFEIHSPGLNLHTSRWTHHLVFMQVVHEDLDRVCALAWDHFEQHGRGALHVSQEHWIQIVRDAVLPGPTPFPASYLPAATAPKTCDFGIVAPGYTALLDAYDPTTQFVLTVEHHPEGLLSAYLIQPDAAGDEAAAAAAGTRAALTTG